MGSVSKHRSRRGAKHSNKGRNIGKVIFLFIVIFALCLFCFEELSKKEPKEILVVVPPDYSALADTLNKAIGTALIDLGILPEWISSTQPKIRDNEREGIFTRTRVKVPGNLPLALCNLEVTRAVQRVGGKVIEGSENRHATVLTLTIDVRDNIACKVILSTNASLERPEGRAAVIIDDFGGTDNEISRGFLNMNQPVTIAVLPHLKASKKIANQAHANGLEVLLHLPMEPHNSQIDPGNKAVFVNLTPDEIQNRVREALEGVPHIKGVNNHMGSKATENESVMEAVLPQIKEKGLFWLDSRTSLNSVAFDVAKKVGVKTAQSGMFLDNEPEVEKIRIKLERLYKLATTEGHVLAIGHCRPLTLQVLRQALPKLEKRGITFVYASELME